MQAILTATKHWNRRVFLQNLKCCLPTLLLSSIRGAVDGFDGEEEVDERYSLLQQDGGDGDDNEQGEGHGSLALNDNSEKQKQEACPIEPFNMTSEREDGSGYFDGDTYVFRRGNPEEEEDA